MHIPTDRRRKKGTRVPWSAQGTASQAPMYYRGASAAILVFDISKRDSFAVMKVRRPLPAMEGGPFPLRPVPSRAFPLPRATVSRRGYYSLAGDEETTELHRAARNRQRTTCRAQRCKMQRTS
jgi:hypothetical protein